LHLVVTICPLRPTLNSLSTAADDGTVIGRINTLVNDLFWDVPTKQVSFLSGAARI